MPEHTGFLTYLLSMSPALRENAHNVGKTFLLGEQVEFRGHVDGRSSGLRGDSVVEQDVGSARDQPRDTVAGGVRGEEVRPHDGDPAG